MPKTAEPPLFFEGRPEEHIRKVALISREMLLGKTNNAEAVTLTANATETKIAKDRVCCDTVVTLSPRSESAAAALASGTVWVEANYGEITIHHDSQPDTDRTFGAVFVG